MWFETTLLWCACIIKLEQKANQEMKICKWSVAKKTRHRRHYSLSHTMRYFASRNSKRDRLGAQLTHKHTKTAAQRLTRTRMMRTSKDIQRAGKCSMNSAETARKCASTSHVPSIILDSLNDTPSSLQNLTTRWCTSLRLCRGICTRTPS